MAQRMMALLAGSAALFAAAVSTSSAQRATPPKARYVMDVSTTSGMGANMNVMSMAFGGGRNAEAHTLDLRLGSTLAPNPAPAKADHFMPAGMKLGLSVPLATPEPPRPGRPEQRDEPTDPDKFQRPKGRMLIFWGCGAKAGPGQPIIIDFSKLAQGQIPPNLFSTSIPADRGPNIANSRTYGSWPNAIGRKAIARDSSLIGEHRIAGNYSPEIKFALSQDFMQALHLQSNAQASGATDLSWNPVANATGFYAHGIGFSGGGPNDAHDIIWWTSSARKEFGGGLTDWLPPSTVQRLIGERVVMPASQIQCTIPAEVKEAGGAIMMLSLYAYGPEANFAYPPRPANPKLAWNPDWTVRVRYRTTTSSFLGMPGAADAGGSQSEPGKPRKRCRPSLGGVIGGVLGGGGC